MGYARPFYAFYNLFHVPAFLSRTDFFFWQARYWNKVSAQFQYFQKILGTVLCRKSLEHGTRGIFMYNFISLYLSI